MFLDNALNFCCNMLWSPDIMFVWYFWSILILFFLFQFNMQFLFILKYRKIPNISPPEYKPP